MHDVINAKTLAIAVFCLLFVIAFSGAALASDGYIDVKVKNSDGHSINVDVYIDGNKAGFGYVKRGSTETFDGFEVEGNKQHTVKVKPSDKTSLTKTKYVGAGDTVVFSFEITCTYTCTQDSECDDGDSTTIDTCKNPSTCSSNCYHAHSETVTPPTQPLTQFQNESVDCNVECNILQTGGYECNTNCEDIMPENVSFFAISAGAVGWKLAGVDGAEDIGIVITRNIHDIAIPENTLGIASGLRNLEHYSIKLFSKAGEKLFEMRVVKDAGRYFAVLGEKIKAVEPVLGKVLNAFADELPVSKSWLSGALKSLGKAASSTLRIVGKQGSAKIGGLLLAPLRILSSAPVAAVSLFLLLDEIPAGDNASVFDKIIGWLDHLVNWKSYDPNFCLPLELKGSPYFSNTDDSEF